MKVITRKELCERICQNWAGGYVYLDDSSENAKVARRLMGLGRNGDPDQIAEILGTEEWTNIKCMECEKGRLPLAAEFDVSTADTYCTMRICANCLAQALLQCSPHIDEAKRLALAVLLEDTHVGAATDMLKDYLLEKGRIE